MSFSFCHKIIRKDGFLFSSRHTLECLLSTSAKIQVSRYCFPCKGKALLMRHLLLFSFFFFHQVIFVIDLLSAPFSCINHLEWSPSQWGLDDVYGYRFAIKNKSLIRSAPSQTWLSSCISQLVLYHLECSLLESSSLWHKSARGEGGISWKEASYSLSQDFCLLKNKSKGRLMFASVGAWGGEWWMFSFARELHFKIGFANFVKIVFRLASSQCNEYWCIYIRKKLLLDRGIIMASSRFHIWRKSEGMS